MLIGEILKEQFNVKDEDIRKALEIQKEVKTYIGQILIQLGIITEKQLLKALSRQLNIPILDDEYLTLTEELFEKVKELHLDFLIENGFVPIKIEDDVVSLITNDPLKIYVLDYVSKRLDKEFKVYLAEERVINDISRRLLNKNSEYIYEVETDIEKLKDIAFEAPVVKYLNDLITKAVDLNASDIHFEPFRSCTIRLRIDGVLHELETLKEDFFLAVVSRIKLLAGLDIAEKRLPQDGKFYTKIGSSYIDIRVSTIPTVRGEDVVLRLLYRGKLSFNLSELGLEQDHYLVVEELIKKPYGILLVTGPTGSGKTTTLYSILSSIKSSEKKIITIEDPVEYQIDGLTQIQVKPQIGLNFASVLRSILRHDPDIIMIGEIRDKETAQIAVQSALTGHLVLATLHTNDSLSSLFRLIDMGVENYLINASLLGVIAQRIVRLNCPYCSTEVDLQDSVKEKYNFNEIYERFKDLIGQIRLYRGKGCKNCFNTGFKGRTAIFEIFKYDEEIKELFIKTASLSALKSYLKKNSNFRTLREEGIIKVLKGKTTIEEILRVS